LKKLDAYIAKKFLGTFVFMIMVVMSIAIVIDISERLRDFTKPEMELTAWQIATEYYPYFFIHYVNLFSSLIIFLAVLYFTSFMAQRSEVVAILSNGVSFNRFARPYLLVSTFLLLIALVSNHYLVPHANKKRIHFENTYIWTTSYLENTNLMINDSTIIHYNSYTPGSLTVNRLWVETWKHNENGVFTMVRDMQVHTAIGDSLSNKWTLNKVFIRSINDSLETIREIASIDTIMSFNSKDLGTVNNALEAMTTTELIDYRDRQKAKGANNITQIEIILYERTALPFATYILTLIALAVSSRKSREGVGKSLAIGLMTSFIYIFTMKMTAVAATNVGLAPYLAVWVPNLFFMIIAVILYVNRVQNEEPTNPFGFLFDLFRRK
jgi:lipopolysaccharide export system permease protein